MICKQAVAHPRIVKAVGVQIDQRMDRAPWFLELGSITINVPFGDLNERTIMQAGTARKPALMVAATMLRHFSMVVSVEDACGSAEQRSSQDDEQAIIVTAPRTGETIKGIPVSITACSVGEISRTPANRFLDIQISTFSAFTVHDNMNSGEFPDHFPGTRARALICAAF